ncbi:hypothetical protein [Albidovulum sp.]|uniref:hypothetical protein n=1 Tax=Albidovulum sp. TaxID=1872424 RepID=UPI001D29E8C6|nr:hypothetical protein [Paracoccaceae bacterium]MCC0045176.1 hypothetical protein [Defluviimonas sp.]HPE25145.1 hypothetical protein [Albidovulum sp.]MCB2119216.1 hypothetical protein [Paracoccaceae bacterium]MCB2122426.1 hypothetical protein [Paracoccaceae bacterium]
MNRHALAALLLIAVAPARADTPEVTAAEAVRAGESWSISVTLVHPDSGWDHYANSWRVETPEGDVIATRDLTHPHVDEQPFTRALDGVTIPAGVDHVMIRARCNLDGWSSRAFRLDLPVPPQG